MAEPRIILKEYVIFKDKDNWECKICHHKSNARLNRIISHLTRHPKNGIKICPIIAPEQVEELKKKLGLGPDLRGADGQQPQQPGENDDIRQENGNKKRKGAMSPLGTLNGLYDVGGRFSVSDGNIGSLQNLENSIEAIDFQTHIPEQNSSVSELDLAYLAFMSPAPETDQDRERAYVPNTHGLQNQENPIGATGLQLDNEHNSPFPVSNLSVCPRTWECTSHNEERAFVLNTNNGGFQGTNAVGSSGPPNSINLGQYTLSQGQVDHWNDQHTHPHTSTCRNAFGAEMAGEIFLADSPRGFNPDLWKFCLEIVSTANSSNSWSHSPIDYCMSSSIDEEVRKVRLGLLESACSEVKNELTNAPDDDRHGHLYKLSSKFWDKVLWAKLERMKIQVDGVEEIEQNLQKETKEADAEADAEVVSRGGSLGSRWLGYAKRFKNDVADLNVAARRKRSIEETIQLVLCTDNLSKIGDTVIETGRTLSIPVPRISSWNPTSCGSQFVNRNQMPPTQSPPQV